MHRIGLTGGIGSGKSTVLSLLAQGGAATLDADAVSRAVTAPGGAAMPALRERFGQAFIAADGGLDRARMRELVFCDPAARKDLEAIVHPLVGAAVRSEEDRARREGRDCLVYDIPLLVESGRWRAQLDRILVIDCHPRTQLDRVMARSGLAQQEAQAIIEAQAPRALRLAAADIVIFNDGLSLQALAREVRQAVMSFGIIIKAP